MDTPALAYRVQVYQNQETERVAMGMDAYWARMQWSTVWYLEPPLVVTTRLIEAGEQPPEQVSSAEAQYVHLCWDDNGGWAVYGCDAQGGHCRLMAYQKEPKVIRAVPDLAILWLLGYTPYPGGWAAHWSCSTYG